MRMSLVLVVPCLALALVSCQKEEAAPAPETSTVNMEATESTEAMDASGESAIVEGEFTEGENVQNPSMETEEASAEGTAVSAE